PRGIGFLRRSASPPGARHVIPNPIGIGPIAREVGMSAHPRRGYRLVDWRFRLREDATRDLTADLDCCLNACRHWSDNVYVARLGLRRREIADDCAVPALDHLNRLEQLHSI